MYARCLFVLIAAFALSAVALSANPAEHWAWKKPVRPAGAGRQGQRSPPNPIDAFVRAKLDAGEALASPRRRRASTSSAASRST